MTSDECQCFRAINNVQDSGSQCFEEKQEHPLQPGWASSLTPAGRRALLNDGFINLALFFCWLLTALGGRLSVPEWL